MMAEGERVQRAPQVRAEALRILAEVESGGWSDRLLQSREKSLDDPRDRHFLHILVFTTLRWQGALDQALAPSVHGGLARLQPWIRAALRLGLCQATLLQRPAAIAVDSAVNATRTVAGPRPAGLVNAVLRQVLSQGPPALDENATVPAWLLRRWSLRYGPTIATALVHATNTPARPFIVCRPDRGGRDHIAAALAGKGIMTRPAARHPWGLAVKKGTPQSTPEFLRGDFLLMDEGAALIALLATPPDERPVADLTASPGGKAALIAQQAPGGVAAMDIVESRLDALAVFLKERSPEGRTAVLQGDALRPPLAAQVFGCVILDAPCTGLGTLRRRPEKRFRIKPEDIVQCSLRQKEMLESAARLVGPGGGLVYAVCSLEPEEGIDLIRDFLGRHPEFEPHDPERWLGKAGRGLIEGDPPRMVTHPETEDTEGFTAFRLGRV